MDSSTNHQTHNYQQPNYGLLRFRSAPSSLFVNFNESNGHKGSPCEGGLEKDKFSPRFMDYDNNSSNNSNCSTEAPAPPTAFEEKSPSPTAAARAFAGGLPPHYPRQSSNSNLNRHTNSPPGLFNLNNHNGYSAIRNMGNYGMGNGINEDVSPTSNGLKGHNFSSRLPSSLGLLPQISEMGSENTDDTKIAMSNSENHFFNSGFSFNSWNNSTNFLESFSGFKRGQDNTLKVFHGGQNGERGNRIPLMPHRMSLPKSSSEMAAIEKFLQLQDSVPCKIRAKRGCATHPRSIAERVRRTRISERMRKLQELVPNMDKQTNTADMLDLAVEYIKDLQKQFKALSDSRANCKCSSIQKPLPNQIL